MTKTKTNDQKNCANFLKIIIFTLLRMDIGMFNFNCWRGKWIQSRIAFEAEWFSMLPETISVVRRSYIIVPTYLKIWGHQYEFGRLASLSLRLSDYSHPGKKSGLYLTTMKTSSSKENAQSETWRNVFHFSPLLTVTYQVVLQQFFCSLNSANMQHWTVKFEAFTNHIIFLNEKKDPSVWALQ